MPYNESDFQSEFNSWIRKYWEHATFFYELKCTHKNTLPYSAIERHQIQALYDARHFGLAYKISDSGIGFKPFDGFFAQGSPAYLVVLYYKPRKPKMAYFIDIDVLITEMEKTKDKGSLSEKKALEICSYRISLNSDPLGFI